MGIIAAIIVVIDFLFNSVKFIFNTVANIISIIKTGIAWIDATVSFLVKAFQWVVNAVGVVQNTTKRVLEDVQKFLGPIEQSISSHVSYAELSRIVITSISVGGSVSTVLSTVAVDSENWLVNVDHQTVALVSAILTAIVDYFRRKCLHGK